MFKGLRQSTCWYFTENWAAEAEAAGLEDVAGLAVGALGHVQGCALYDYYFGYSRFDPFVTQSLIHSQSPHSVTLYLTQFYTQPLVLVLELQTRVGVGAVGSTLISFSKAPSL